MASKAKPKNKKRTPAQIEATKRMLEGLARSKRNKGKAKAKTATSKPKKKAKAKRAVPPTSGIGIISTTPLAKGSRFGGWKSNTPGDMREVKLPSNARIVTRGRRAVIVYTDK